MKKKKPTQAEVDALFAEMRRLIDATNAAEQAVRETAEYKRCQAIKDDLMHARAALFQAERLLRGEK